MGIGGLFILADVIFSKLHALGPLPHPPFPYLLVQKPLPSALHGTPLLEWLHRHRIDTITVAGYMTHNCDDATIRHGVHAGLSVEFLSDASGSVAYSNRAGYASAGEIHRVFTIVLQSRFAAVMTTDEWIAALGSGVAPERDDIFGSAQRARKRLSPLKSPDRTPG